MAAAKWRRPDRKVPGCQSPRMYFCWLMLISLAMVLGETNRTQVKYDRGAKKLVIVCPAADKGTLQASYLYRIKSSGEERLAEWMEDGQKVTNHYERIEAKASQGPRLEATLSHVTCFDSATYKCRNMIMEDDDYVYRNYSAPFQYTGEITKPYLTAPIRTRYTLGEELQLNCSAAVGWEDNSIVWFITRATESEKIPLETHISQEQSVDPDCSLQSSSQLRYTITAQDDGAIFECRLQRSGHHSEVIIALRCPDVQANRPDDSGAGVPTKPTDPHNYKDSPRAEQVKGLGSEDSSSNSSLQGTDNLTLMIVVCSLVVIVALAAGAMFLLMRRWRKRQMPALVVVDTPTSSEYGYSTSSSERQLPHLPNLSSMLDRHNPHSHQRHPRHPLRRHLQPHQRHQRHHSFPDDFSAPFQDSVTGSMSSTSRYVDSPLSFSAHHKDDPNLSVYVTMTNLDYLHPSKELADPAWKRAPALGAGPADAPHSLAGGSPTSVGSEYDNMGPDMREERSESIYSNDGWNYARGVKMGGGSNGGGGARNDTNAGNMIHSDVAADEVTRLKIVD